MNNNDWKERKALAEKITAQRQNRVLVENIKAVNSFYYYHEKKISYIEFFGYKYPRKDVNSFLRLLKDFGESYVVAQPMKSTLYLTDTQERYTAKIQAMKI